MSLIIQFYSLCRAFYPCVALTPRTLGGQPAMVKGVEGEAKSNRKCEIE
jgi:hypothetical protein